MSRITKGILKTEGWVVGILFVLTFITYSIIPKENFYVEVAASFFVAVVLFGWLLIVGIGLNDNLPDNLRQRDKFFILACAYCIFITSIAPIPLSVTIELGIVLFILYFISFYYLLYFVSLMFIENQTFYGEGHKLKPALVFILVLMFIVGVFILQPRIKKLIQD